MNSPFLIVGYRAIRLRPFLAVTLLALAVFAGGAMARTDQPVSPAAATLPQNATNAVVAGPVAGAPAGASSPGGAQGQADNRKPVTVSVDVFTRIVALVLSAIIVLAAASFAARGRPHRFIIGADGRLSNSKTQLALWSAVLATSYLATVGLRVANFGLGYVTGVGIGEHLLALSGLSALAYGGAKTITLSKIDQATQPPANGPGGAPRPMKTMAARANFSDLFTNDKGQADLGDFQMIAIAFAAAIGFGLSVFHFLETLPQAATIPLPDVDTTLLAGFGVGQGAYLFKKAASKLGEG